MEVEVVGGPHDGKKAVVLKASGEGSDKRWRVLLAGGQPTWVDMVKPMDGDGAAAAPVSAATEEGSIVEVVGGPNAGTRGVVLKVSEDGAETRWRVLPAGGGAPIWADRVKPAEAVGDSPVRAAGADDHTGMSETCSEGEMVKVLSGPHAGHSAVVVRAVTDGAQGRRWEVIVDGAEEEGPQTVEDVQPLFADLVRAARAPPRAPAPPADNRRRPPTMPAPNPDDYLVDDSASEASDPEMPELQPY